MKALTTQLGDLLIIPRPHVKGKGRTESTNLSFMHTLTLKHIQEIRKTITVEQWIDKLEETDSIRFTINQNEKSVE